MNAAKPKPNAAPIFFTPVFVGAFDRITIGTTHYRLSKNQDGFVILHTEGEIEKYTKFTEFAFYEGHKAGDILIDENFHARTTPAVVSDPAFTFMDNLPHKRAKARFYLELIKQYEALVPPVARSVEHLGPLMFELSANALEITRRLMAGETIKTFGSPSVGHFNKMYRKYKNSGEDIQALVSLDAGPKRRYEADEESMAIWQKWADAYASPNKQAFAVVYKLLIGEISAVNKEREEYNKQLGEDANPMLCRPILAIPKPKRFRREIKKLGAYYVYHQRHGRKAADEKFGLTSGGFELFRPGQRVDIDEKEMDLMALLQYANIWDTMSDDEKKRVRRIRLWVVVAIDLATRYVLGMRFCTAPNSQTTIDVIKMCMQDKSEFSDYAGAITRWIGACRPRSIYTDNGSGLVNDDVADILAACQISHFRPKAGEPRARGHIESSFRGHRRIVRNFQGQTFSSILEKGNYNAVATASIPIDELERHYIKAILDVYHNTPHEGLAGETPELAWMRLTQKYKTRPRIHPHIFRHIFGMDFTRKLSSHGILFLGVPYYHPKLGEWFTTAGDVKVNIKVDLLDMTSITFVMDGARYIAKNTIGLAPNMSVAEFMEVWRRLTRTFKENSEVGMEVVYATMRELYDSGEAAALRNPLGIRRVSREKIEQHEKALLARGALRFRAASDDTPPAALTLGERKVRRGAFLDESAVGFDNPVQELTQHAIAAEAHKKAAPSLQGNVQSAQQQQQPNTKSASLLGSADDIEF